MVHERKFLAAGISLVLIVFILNLPFLHSLPLGNYFFTKLGLPVYGNEETMTGIHYVGVTCTGLLLIGLGFINRALNRHNVKVVIAAAIISLAGPVYIVNAMQRTILSGIYAVSYDQENSRCEFTLNEAEQRL
ncbi:hypothetical protein FZC66_06780 [Priestia megaterium]|nr:hypothetical protein FZC66_06780 [Priestia megaterium]